jgi:iron complex outermembrane receptor protein
MNGTIMLFTLCASVFLSPSITFAQTEQPAVVSQPQAEGSRPSPPGSPAEPVQLPPITVEAPRPPEAGYTVDTATTATKTETPIIETPVSIQVVPQQVIEDQQAMRLEDVTKNVSGVQTDWGYGHLYEQFVIRGFTTSDIFRDGVRLGRTTLELGDVERIEVLKGPAAVLYGRIEPGGLINLVTKRPSAEAGYSLQQQFGSYNQYRTMVDLTGPLTQDRSLLYRFHLTYQNSDSFRDFVHDERVFLAPYLTWRPNEDLEFNFSLKHLTANFPYDNGIPGSRLGPAPIRLWTGEPQDNTTVDNLDVDFNWSYRLADTWTIRNGMHWYRYTNDYEQIYPLAFDPDTSIIERAPWFVDQQFDSKTVYLDLTGQVSGLGMEHSILVGGDYYFEDVDDRGFTNGFSTYDTFDIFHPVYGTVDFAALRWLQKNAADFFLIGTSEWFGLYFQDQITLWENIHLLGGGRYDWVHHVSGFSPTSFRDIQKETVNNDTFSPRVGLVYQPWPWLAFYGNYVEGLGFDNSGRSFSGKPFPPEESTQYEGGVKTDLPGGRFTSTVAFYHLTKTNVLTADPEHPQFSIALGEVRSRGIEVDLAGQVTDALSVIASYALTDARITKSNDGDEGRRFPNVAEHTGSVWLRYEFLRSPLRGLRLGAGVSLASNKEGDNGNSFELPGYVRADAFAAYSWRVGDYRVTAQFNINNLFDKKYFKNTDTLDGVPRANILPGEPLSALGSLRVEY